VRCALALLAVLPLACGDEAPPELTRPELGTEWVLVGSAGTDRGLGPLDARIVRASELGPLVIPGRGSVRVDLLYAGLDPASLPTDVDPGRLELAPIGRAGVRPLPALTQPHLLREPAAPGTEAELVPVGTDPGRQQRLQRLTESLGIVDPCRAPAAPFADFPQRSPASAVTALRFDDAGSILIGLTSTSTAVYGTAPASGGTMVELPVHMGEPPVQPGERVSVVELGDGEVDTGTGLRPERLVLVRGGVLGHLAVWTATAGRHRDDTPRSLDRAPAALRGSAVVRRGGQARLCIFGAVAGSGGRSEAGVWCREPAGGGWAVAAVMPNAARIVALLDGPEGRAWAVDVGGTVYEDRGDTGWAPVLSADVNQGCFPICVGLRTAAVGVEGDPTRLVLAGDTVALALRGTSVATARYEPLPLTRALFSDEREGPGAIELSAAVVAPDGAIWLAPLSSRFVVRVSPDLGDATRICLPDGGVGAESTALAASPDGRLVLGARPTRIAVGTWRSP
jgi:hypothetical protein